MLPSEDELDEPQGAKFKRTIKEFKEINEGTKK